MAARRTVLKIKVVADDRPTQVVRFPADRWQLYEMHLAAAETQLQILDAPNSGFVQETLLALKSDVEGVQWWKISDVAPSTSSTPLLPTRELRPYEVTDDRAWDCRITGDDLKPAIVVYNPTAVPANVQVFYATRITDTQCGGI